MPRLPSPSVADRRDGFSGNQAAADDLVSGDLPDQPSQTGLSALALRRQLGVSYPTAWLIQHKLMQAMVAREERYVLEGKVQVDDAYLGGERTGGKVGRGSENKVAFVAAVSLTADDRPLRVRLTAAPALYSGC